MPWSSFCFHLYSLFFLSFFLLPGNPAARFSSPVLWTLRSDIWGAPWLLSRGQPWMLTAGKPPGICAACQSPSFFSLIFHVVGPLPIKRVKWFLKISSLKVLGLQTTRKLFLEHLEHLVHCCGDHWIIKFTFKFTLWQLRHNDRYLCIVYSY